MKVPKARRMSSGNYFVQLRLGGTSIPITAGSEAEATKKAELIKAEYRNGKNVTKYKKAGEKTLKQVLDDFVDSRKAALSPATVRGYNTIKKCRFPNYQGKRLDSIDFQKMINDELASVSEKTVQNAWGLVRSSLDHAGFPVPAVRLAAVPVNEIAFLQPDEILKFCSTIKGRKYEIPALLLLHGMRQSEVQALRWENVDLEHGFITVHGAIVPGPSGPVEKKQNKNRTSTRKVPIMIPRLSEALEACEVKDGLVVPQAPCTLLGDVKRACRMAGITEVTAHGLRHSFASLCYRQGVSERQTMSWGGWSDYHTMHKIYIRLSAVGETEAKDLVSSFFSG